MTKKIYLFLLISISAFACKKTSVPATENPESNYNEKDWMRIKIPSGGEALAIAGSITDTLVVTSLYDTYLITKNGRKVTPTLKNLRTIPGLLSVQDTIYALVAQSFDAKYEKHFTAIASYYTLDKGQNWHNISLFGKSMLNGVATSSNRTSFNLQYHAGADLNGNHNSNWVLRTTINKTTASGSSTKFTPPIENRQPINLHIDQNNRLYITTGGGFSDAGVYMSPSSQNPAYIYISKDPV